MNGNKSPSLHGAEPEYFEPCVDARTWPQWWELACLLLLSPHILHSSVYYSDYWFPLSWCWAQDSYWGAPKTKSDHAVLWLKTLWELPLSPAPARFPPAALSSSFLNKPELIPTFGFLHLLFPLTGMPFPPRSQEPASFLSRMSPVNASESPSRSPI